MSFRFAAMIGHPLNNNSTIKTNYDIRAPLVVPSILHNKASYSGLQCA